MKGVKQFKNYVKQQLKNKKFRRGFEEEDVYATVAIQLAKIRQEKKLTQSELARSMHTTQQTISRLENAHNMSLSIQTLINAAHALGKKIEVRFV